MGPRWRRVLGWILLAAGGLTALAVAGVLAVSNTPWGREWVRDRVVTALDDTVDGRFDIGGLEGNLLAGGRLRDVEIVDADGRPFVRAGTLAWRHSLRGLLRRRIVLSGVEIRDAHVVLDRPPGRDWNFTRIFAGEEDRQTDPDPGWGSWVELRDVRTYDTRVTVRLPWEPSAELDPGERDDRIRTALAGETVEVVVAVPGGWQRVMEFGEIEAHLARIVVADPDSPGIPIEIEALSGLAEPFRAPSPGRIQRLSGVLMLESGALHAEDLEVALPGTRLSIDGRLGIESRAAAVALHADPITLEDFRFLHPPLPTGVTGGGRLTLRMGEGSTRFAADELDFQVEHGRVEGRLHAGFGEQVVLDDADLRFSDIRTGFVEEVVPRLSFPQAGTLSGHVVAGNTRTSGARSSGPIPVDARVRFADEAGDVSAVRADGSVTPGEGLRLHGLTLHVEALQAGLVRAAAPGVRLHGVIEGSALLDGPARGPLTLEGVFRHHDPVAGTSRIGLAGGVDATDGLELDRVRVELDPLRLEVLRDYAEGVPAGSALTGVVRLDGSPDQVLRFAADLDLEESGSHSRMEATGEVATGAEGRVRADLQLHELALATLGRFAPQAEIEGVATGRVRVEGSFRDLLARAELQMPGSGTLEGDARLELGAGEPRYDVALRLEGIDVSAISGRVTDSTAVRGTARVRGQGTDPAHMQADVEAELVDEAPDGDRTLEARIAIDDGLLRADTVAFRMHGAHLDAHGTLGLRADREGELSVRAAVDSLHVLEPLFPLEPGDTTALAGVRREASTGSATAIATLRGNVDRLEASGTLEGDELVFGGHAIHEANVAFESRVIGGEAAEARLDVRARGLLLAGFAYDELELSADVRDGDPRSGRFTVAVLQDEHTEITADAGLELGDGHGELRLETLTIQLEDALYTASHPGLIRWTEHDVTVDELELRSDAGALVRVEGALPVRALAATPGSAGRDADGLDIHVAQLQLAHVATLLQDREDVRGWLGLELPVRGTLADPRFEGTAALTELEVNGQAFPEAHATFVYGDRRLETEATLVYEGRTILDVEALLPIDLGLVDVEETLLRDAPLRVDARLDELVLEPLPALTDQVEALTGHVSGRFSVAGTFSDPETEGALELRVPSVYVVPLAVRISDVVGSLSLDGRIVTVDSLVARSRGPIRVSGELDLATAVEPTFDLVVRATDARVIDTEDARLRLDADLVVSGPFDDVAITGEVRTRQGVIRIPEQRELTAPGPLDLEDPSVFERVDARFVDRRDALIHRSPLLENLRLDLEVRIDRDVWIRSTEANVEIFTEPAIGPLRVQMQGIRARDLRIYGTVSTARGEYEFMGRRFNLARGSVVFAGDALDPILRLTAEHPVQLPGREAFDIRIVLDGTLSDLDTEIDSTAEPPLSQSDLLSFVVFGRDAGSLFDQQGSSLSGQGTSAGPLVGQAATRAAQQLATAGFHAVLTELEAETARSFGLDVLRIQPADMPAEVSTGDFLDVLRGTEIEAGRYVTPRLFVSGQARPTFVHPGARLEYDTDHGWTWRVTWRPRFLPAPPTLSREAPDRASVFGTLLFREWRF